MKVLYYSALFLVLTGCVTTPTPRVVVTEKTGTRAVGSEAIAIVDASPIRRHLRDAECVRLAIEASNPSLWTMPGARFRDAMYPWFEPETAPANADELTLLLARPAVRARLEALNVRYVVIVDANTTSRDEGFFFCGGGYGGAGCLGIGSQALESTVKAAVWDIKRQTSAGKVSSTATGDNVSIGVVVPLFFVSKTEEAACAGLGQEVARMLGAGHPSAQR
jgi:hypothetical protein